MKRLYTVAPPIPMRDELMTHGEFFVPQSRAGYKVAEFLGDSTKEDRMRLFKIAVEKGTQDLAKAYNVMCNGGDTPKDTDEKRYELDDPDDDDDYGQESFDEADDSEADEDGA